MSIAIVASLFLVSACRANDLECQYFDVWGKGLSNIDGSYTNPIKDAKDLFISKGHIPYFIYYEGGDGDLGISYAKDESYQEAGGKDYFIHKDFEKLINFYNKSKDSENLRFRLISITGGLKGKDLARRALDQKKNLVDAKCYREDIREYIDLFNFQMLVEFYERGS